MASESPARNTLIILVSLLLLAAQSVGVVFAQAQEPVPLRGVTTTTVDLLKPSAVSVDGSQSREDPLSLQNDQAAEPPLTGYLSTSELVGAAAIADDLKTITITVSNKGKRTLMLDGDAAWSSTEKVRQQVLLRNQVIRPPRKDLLSGDTLSIALSIGSIGVIPVVVDAVQKNHEGGVAFYGRDQSRRKLAELRFGQRVLFPGESVKGDVFLSRSQELPGVLNVPVSLHPDGKDLGLLELTLMVPSNKSVADSGDKPTSIISTPDDKQTKLPTP